MENRKYMERGNGSKFIIFMGFNLRTGPIWYHTVTLEIKQKVRNLSLGHQSSYRLRENNPETRAPSPEYKLCPNYIPELYTHMAKHVICSKNSQEQESGSFEFSHYKRVYQIHATQIHIKKLKNTKQNITN